MAIPSPNCAPPRQQQQLDQAHVHQRIAHRIAQNIDRPEAPAPQRQGSADPLDRRAVAPPVENGRDQQVEAALDGEGPIARVDPRARRQQQDRGDPSRHQQGHGRRLAQRKERQRDRGRDPGRRVQSQGAPAQEAGGRGPDRGGGDHETGEGEEQLDADPSPPGPAYAARRHVEPPQSGGAQRARRDRVAGACMEADHHQRACKAQPVCSREVPAAHPILPPVIGLGQLA